MASDQASTSYNSQSRLEQYKLFNRLPSSSSQLSTASERFISNIRNNSALLDEVVADLRSEHAPVRLGSCKVLGKILDTPAEPCGSQLTAKQTTNMIQALVEWLKSTTTSVEATAILWSLKKKVLVSHAELKSNILSILESCQIATKLIKSELASRPSYAVAASTLQLIARLYVDQKEEMQMHTKIWFSLTLPYCCHNVSKLLRVNAEEIIELSYDHLLQRADELKSIVLHESVGVVAQLTTILHKQYDESCKLFAIKLWGQLVTILGSEIETITISNLYLSAMSKAFSKNYLSRQTAAFKAWKLLVQNFSMQYLLRPVILKRVCVPLTKSNYTDEKESVEARLDCWWTLIRKLGGELTNHFTEVCKPLLQFCTETSMLAADRSHNLIAEVRNSSKTRTADILRTWCLAASLQLLGQYDRRILPHVSLGNEQRNPLVRSVIQYNGKVLVQAFLHSYDYVHHTADLLQQGWLNDLLKAYQTLVEHIIDLVNSGSSGDVGRQLARMIFAFISTAQVNGSTVLDLVLPASKFDKSVLSSTTYSPSSVNSMTTTPALSMLEKVYHCCAQMAELDEQRCCECLSLLINKGLPDGRSCYTFIERCTSLVPVAEQLVGVVTSSLLTIASLTQAVCRKDGKITDLEHVLPIFTELVSKFPLDVIGDLLEAISDHLELILQSQLSGELEEKIRRLWQAVLDKLTAAEYIHCVSPHTASTLLPALLCSVKHPSLTELSIQMWADVMRNHTSVEDHRQFRLTMAQLKPQTHDNEEPTSDELAYDLPTQVSPLSLPSSDTPVQESPPKDPPTPDRVMDSQPLKKTLSSSPNSSSCMKKKRLIPSDHSETDLKQEPNSGVRPPVQESLGLLNGLVTPEKRRKLTETSPPPVTTPSITPRSPKKGAAKHTTRRENTPPIIENSPPTIENTPLIIEDTPPIIEHTPPIIELTPPIIELTPPIIEHAPPISEKTSPISQVVNEAVSDVQQSQVISDCEDNNHSSSQQISDTVTSCSDERLTPQLTRSRPALARTPALPMTSPAPAPSPPPADQTPLRLNLIKEPIPDLAQCHVKIERSDRLDHAFDSFSSMSWQLDPTSQPTSCSQATSSWSLRGNRRKTHNIGCQASQETQSEFSQKLKLRRLVKAPIVDRQCPSQAYISMIRNVSAKLVKCTKVKVIQASEPEGQDYQSDPTSDIFDGILTHDSFFDCEESLAPQPPTLSSETPSVDNPTLNSPLSTPQSPTTQPPTPQSPTPQSPTPQPSTTQSQTPQSPTPQSPTPQPSTTQSLTPQSSTPQSQTPQSPTPQSQTPQPSTPQPPTPQSPTLQPQTPQSLTPQSQTPQPQTPQSLTPQPSTTQSPTSPLLTFQPLTSQSLTSQSPTSPSLTSSQSEDLSQSKIMQHSTPPSNQPADTSTSAQTILKPNSTASVAEESAHDIACESSADAHMSNSATCPQPSTEQTQTKSMSASTALVDPSPPMKSKESSSRLEMNQETSSPPRQRPSESLPDREDSKPTSQHVEESADIHRDEKRISDDDFIGSQFDEEMDIPSQTDKSVAPVTVPPADSNRLVNTARGEGSKSAVLVVENGGEVTPVRPSSYSNSQPAQVKLVSSPSTGRTQSNTLLKMNSRSSQILAKAMSGRNNQSSPSGMSEVNTAPATPRSSKLSLEARELDCTPIYSPTTGSILKRKHVRSPADFPSKRVKFQLPELPSRRGDESQQIDKPEDDADIFATYSCNGVSAESPMSNDSSQSSTAVSRDPPIASEYTQCTVPIDDMVVHLTKPIWQGNLKQCLVSQGVTTVGHMAQLTEADVQLLPISKPKLSTALKAFKKSGATKNSAARGNSRPRREQVERIARLVTDEELTDAELGRKVRDIFAGNKNT